MKTECCVFFILLLAYFHYPKTACPARLNVEPLLTITLRFYSGLFQIVIVVCKVGQSYLFSAN